MIIEQIYTGCLAQGAYYIESKGEAVIIDPLRETSPYIEKLQRSGARLKYIFETHFHADFVSGHIDLARKTGATIVFGPLASTEYDIHSAQDGEVLTVGEVSFTVLHTPGHTMESTVYLLKNAQGEDHAIFTGDTLFLGDVGRPDLAIKHGKITKEDLAGFLFDSLRNKIMPLGDHVIVYPAHGAGSACGKNLSKDTWGYLGDQKKTNYALRSDMSREEFIAEVLTGLTPAPHYFAQNAMMNKSGYDRIEDVIKRGAVALGPHQFEEMVERYEALVLDTRSAQDFAQGHIPNAINIGIDGSFAPWVGALITDIKQSILLVVPEGRAEEVVTRLARVGYDNTYGYLSGGMIAWKETGKEIVSIESISPAELAKRMTTGQEVNLVDVRKPSEYLAHHALDAENIPLDYLNSNMHRFDRKKTYHIHCAGGYRSMIAASILKSRGFDDIIDVQQGFKGIEEGGIIEISAYTCPSTLPQEVVDAAVAAVI